VETRGQPHVRAMRNVAGAQSYFPPTICILYDVPCTSRVITLARADSPRGFHDGLLPRHRAALCRSVLKTLIALLKIDSQTEDKLTRLHRRFLLACLQCRCNEMMDAI